MGRQNVWVLSAMVDFPISEFDQSVTLGYVGISYISVRWFEFL